MAQKRSDGSILMSDGTAAIIVDEGPHPVIVTTWFGEATVPLVDEYYAWLGTRMAKARTTGERLVLLNDTFAVERPTPMVRKRLADLTSAQNKNDGKAMIGSVVVVESALIRGAVTALGWIVPSLSESDFVGTLDEAIDRCLAILAREEVRTPSNLRSYRRPARP